MNTCFKNTILYSMLILSGITNAQTDFRPGFIIDLKGDTLIGKIDYRSDLSMGTICRFQFDNNNTRVYSPDEIAAFRFTDSKYYISKEINGAKFFLEFLIEGKVNIYYLRDSNGDNYYIEKEGKNLMEIPYEEGTRKVNNKEMFYRTTKHIGILYYYMDDAPQLKTRIENIKKPDHQYLVDLAEDYHNAVCKDEQCIIYEKRMPLVKVNVELIGGPVYYQYFGDLKFSAGILTHWWLPRVNEKLYFRTGLLFSELEEDGVRQNVLKTPIQIEYLYPKGMIRPTLAYGMNLYHGQGYSVAFMGGINIELASPVSLGIYYDIDFQPYQYFQFLPQRLISQFVSAGFRISL